MKRRLLLLGAAGAAGAALAGQPLYRIETAAQIVFSPRAAAQLPDAKEFAEPEPWAAKLIQAGLSQIGETVTYDPAYTKLTYPGGDVPRERGVCTDVVIRAYRDAHGLDLQKLVHEDMRKDFKSYPKLWGLKRPDSNIDHRRVPNLETYLTRRGAKLDTAARGEDFAPGDLVTVRLPGNLPHIMLVSHLASEDGARPLVIHNIGAGTRLEDSLLRFEMEGRFRLRPRSV